MKRHDVPAAGWTDSPPPEELERPRPQARRRRPDAHFGPGTLLIGLALLALGIVLTLRLTIFFT